MFPNALQQKEEADSQIRLTIYCEWADHIPSFGRISSESLNQMTAYTPSCGITRAYSSYITGNREASRYPEHQHPLF